MRTLTQMGIVCLVFCMIWGTVWGQKGGMIIKQSSGSAQVTVDLRKIPPPTVDPIFKHKKQEWYYFVEYGDGSCDTSSKRSVFTHTYELPGPYPIRVDLVPKYSLDSNKVMTRTVTVLDTGQITHRSLAKSLTVKSNIQQDIAGGIEARLLYEFQLPEDKNDGILVISFNQTGERNLLKDTYDIYDYPFEPQAIDWEYYNCTAEEVKFINKVDPLNVNDKEYHNSLMFKLSEFKRKDKIGQLALSLKMSSDFKEPKKKIKKPEFPKVELTVEAQFIDAIKPEERRSISYASKEMITNLAVDPNYCVPDGKWQIYKGPDTKAKFMIFYENIGTEKAKSVGLKLFLKSNKNQLNPNITITKISGVDKGQIISCDSLKKMTSIPDSLKNGLFCYEKTDKKKFIYVKLVNANLAGTDQEGVKRKDTRDKLYFETKVDNFNDIKLKLGQVRFYAPGGRATKMDRTRELRWINKPQITIEPGYTRGMSPLASNREYNIGVNGQVVFLSRGGPISASGLRWGIHYSNLKSRLTYGNNTNEISDSLNLSMIKITHDRFWSFRKRSKFALVYGVSLLIPVNGDFRSSCVNTDPLNNDSFTYQFGLGKSTKTGSIESNRFLGSSLSVGLQIGQKSKPNLNIKLERSFFTNFYQDEYDCEVGTVHDFSRINSNLKNRINISLNFPLNDWLIYGQDK